MIRPLTAVTAGLLLTSTALFLARAAVHAVRARHGSPEATRDARETAADLLAPPPQSGEPPEALLSETAERLACVRGSMTDDAFYALVLEAARFKHRWADQGPPREPSA